ncbi:MAG: AraC family transcriptional regulator [Bacteroidales bacterium]|nr:AraC family transcriptional regulator [Candidatus Cacconaster merdequi]
MEINYIYLLASLVSLFWIIRIFLLKELNISQLFIVAGLFMAVLAMVFSKDFVYFVFPLFYLAVRRKTSPSGIAKWDCLFLFASALAIPLLDDLSGMIFIGVQIVSIAVLSFISISRYKSRFAELFASEGEFSGDDISEIFTYILMMSVVSAVTLFLPESVVSSLTVQLVLALFLSVLQYKIGEYTFYMKDPTSSMAELLNEVPVEPQNEQKKGDIQADESIRLLLKRVLDEKLFLDSSLSLVSLADKLDTNRTYLSSAIHASDFQNFSDFINTLRINHCVELFRTDSNLNIKDAAISSGYANLQSFYRNFSEKMQMTPKEFLKTINTSK